MKSIRESMREFHHAWADLLRILAEMLNESAARIDGRAFRDEERERAAERPICVCMAPDLFCEVHNA
jgi:hypothetical protein